MTNITPISANSTTNFINQATKINEVIEALSSTLPIVDGVATNLSSSSNTPTSANSFVTKLYVESNYVSNNYVNLNLMTKNMLIINW